MKPSSLFQGGIFSNKGVKVVSFLITQYHIIYLVLEEIIF